MVGSMAVLLLQQGGEETFKFFSSWKSLFQIALHSAAFYIVVVAALRIVGQRALAKMSGYDMIVTVALGSLVAGIATSRDVSVADGAAAVATFLAIQQATSWLQTRYHTVHKLVREKPVLVVWDGQFLDDRLLKASISHDEIRAAIRRAGMLSMAQVQGVILENDGEWSVIGRDGDAPDLSALDGLDVPYLLPPDADPATWRDTAPHQSPGHPADMPPDERAADRPAERRVERDADRRRRAPSASTTGPL